MNWPTWLPLRKDLTPLTPYGAPQVPARASLNTNENPYSPSPALQKAISDAVLVVTANLNRYPDRDADVLRSKLAGYINASANVKVTVAVSYTHLRAHETN
jgi:histidinol-phosphate aminotransferase